MLKDFCKLFLFVLITTLCFFGAIASCIASLYCCFNREVIGGILLFLACVFLICLTIILLGEFANDY